MEIARRGCIGPAGRLPTIARRIIPTTATKNITTLVPTPDDHFHAGPHRGMVRSRHWCVRQAHLGPSISGWVIPVSGVYFLIIVDPAPHNHFTAGPHRGVLGGRKS